MEGGLGAKREGALRLGVAGQRGDERVGGDAERDKRGLARERAQHRHAHRARQAEGRKRAAEVRREHAAGAHRHAPEQLVKRLASGLLPFAAQYPLPFYKLEG